VNARYRRGWKPWDSPSGYCRQPGVRSMRRRQ
jgi:hypothetical protein